jgi:integrase
MSKRRKRGSDRLYWRDDRQGWYADLRSWGGGREAMIPDGEIRATADRDIATRIMVMRIEELKEHPPAEDRKSDPTLEQYAQRHFTLKSRRRKPATIEREKRALSPVYEFFGSDVRLSEITVARLCDYDHWRGMQPGRGGTPIKPQTRLHELHAVSSVCRRAVAEGIIAVNPVSLLPDKPSVGDREATYLEPGEAARLLKVTCAMDTTPHRRSIPFLYPLLATLLLTGGRAREVFGIQVDDIDLEQDVVRIRVNEWRGLKSRHSRRDVPLWPQLREIIEEHIEKTKPTTLLFPARHGGMLHDIRGSLDKATAAAKIDKRVTPKTMRHTYTAMRLQTTDRGAPISPWTVARELGHSSVMLIERVYGHLLNTRHRADVVEYHETEVVDLQMGNRESA